MGVAGFVCVLGGVGVLCALLTGGALVRAAVTIANRVLGPPKEKSVDPIEDWDWDDDLEPARPRLRVGDKVIPVPGYGAAMGIAFLAALAAGVGFVVLGMVTDISGIADMEDEWTRAAVGVFTVPAEFAALTLVLTLLLPTTLTRAALTAFVHHALVLSVLVVVIVAIFFFGVLFG
jgi:hypothetical protein